MIGRGRLLRPQEGVGDGSGGGVFEKEGVRKSKLEEDEAIVEESEALG